MNWISIGSDNGLLPIQRQAIIWTNDDLLSIGTNFSEISIKIQTFSFKKMYLRMLSVKWWLFYPGGDEFIMSVKEPLIIQPQHNISQPSYISLGILYIHN